MFVSAPSTFVYAAQLRTMEGTIRLNVSNTASRFEISRCECANAVTSSPIERQCITAARASIPFAPVIKTDITIHIKDTATLLTLKRLSDMLSERHGQK